MSKTASIFVQIQQCISWEDLVGGCVAPPELNTQKALWTCQTRTTKTPCLDAKKHTGQTKKGKYPFKWYGLVALLRFLGLRMAYHVTDQLRLGLYCLFFLPMTSHKTNSYVIRHPRILHIWSTRNPALFNFTSLHAIFHNPHWPKWIYKTIIWYKRNITPCALFLFFSNTYNSVQANANQIWKFQRYYLVMEYAQRPVLVPPFIILNHVIHLIKGIYRRLRKCCRHKKTDREDSTRSYGLSMCIVLGRLSAVSLLDLS